MPTLRDTLRDLARRFEAAGVPSPRVDAEVLVTHALGLTPLDVRLRSEQELTSSEVERVEALARRREAREPLQHLTGEVEWGGVTLLTPPGALIPRPETERLLELTLHALHGHARPDVLDVGTGTGALALGVKHARPDARVHATDLSADALRVARANAKRLALDVTFAHGHLTAGLQGPFDVVVSNPPYLPDADAHDAQPEVRHDPHVALYAGPDGLAVARPLARSAARLLAPGGTLLIELDARNVHVLAAELTRAGWSARVEPDLAGRDRFLIAQRS